MKVKSSIRFRIPFPTESQFFQKILAKNRAKKWYGSLIFEGKN